METDQIIAEIARATGLRLDKADPILAAAVINEVLLDRALVKLDRQVKVQADRVTAASTQAVLDAKKESEALLTESGTWIEAKIKEAGEAVVLKISAELREELSKVQVARQTMVRIAVMLALIGLLVISALTGFTLASLH